MRDNKYEKILSVSSSLISRKGYHGTSFQEIADKVGVHKSTLFHYVKSKEELLLRILEENIEKVTLNLEKIITDERLQPEEKLKKAIENHLFLLTEYRDNVNIYLNELKNLPAKYKAVYVAGRKKYEKDFEAILAEMQKKGYFKGLDTKIVTFGVLGMLNWVPRWYRAEGRLSIDEISDILYKLIAREWE